MFEREPLVGTMSAQVAKILGTRIVGGEFKPGELLPVEAELCTLFGVSRTTIREAIKQLASKRLIEVSPKIGTRVQPFADWNLLDRDVLAWRLHAQFDSKIVDDIFEMRLCFEPRASYLGAISAGPVYDRFREPKLGGVLLGGTIAFLLGAGFEVRAGGDYERWFSSFHPVPGDPHVAGGALDHRVHVHLGAAYAH